MIVREDLARVPLVCVRHLSIGEHQVEVLVPGLARNAFGGPLVLVAGVVEDEVDHERDPRLAQLGRQVPQIVHRSEARIDLPVAADCVAAIVLTLRREEERHQVQVGEAQLLEVRDLLGHGGERPCVTIRVTDAAEHALGLEPGGGGGAPGVQRLQVRRPGVPGLGGEGDHVRQRVPQIFPLAVDALEEAVQGGEVLVIARGELGIEPAGARLGNFPAQRAIELDTVCAHECLLAPRDSLHSLHYQLVPRREQDSTCRIFESVGCRMPYMV